MKARILSWSLFFLLGLLLQKAWTATPVEEFGNLSVKGNKIVDKRGVPVQLRGMSFFWSQWQGSYWNRNVVDWLVDDWKVTVVRAAMGVEHNGYLQNPTIHKEMVETIVNAAIAKGIYVIIDWHDHNAPVHVKQAKVFFSEMAHTYGSHPNIIYEIFNEPDNESWSTIKSYANEIIHAIRQDDPDNLILVGTPKWSQDVDIASASPVNENNIAYSLHFYSASHDSSLRSKAKTALSNNIALFVSEWGLSESSGDGIIDTIEGQNWINFMDLHNISWCNWSIANKVESSAALRREASITGTWEPEELTYSGKWVREKLRFYNYKDVSGSLSEQYVILPGTLYASRFSNMKGIQTEITEDVGGGENIGFIENEDWTEYRIQVQHSGYYKLETRVASKYEGGLLVILVDGSERESLNISSTGDWQNWETINGNIYLDKGQHALRLEFRGNETITGLYNVNWLKFLSEETLQETEN